MISGNLFQYGKIQRMIHQQINKNKKKLNTKAFVAHTNNKCHHTVQSFIYTLNI